MSDAFDLMTEAYEDDPRSDSHQRPRYAGDQCQRLEDTFCPHCGKGLMFSDNGVAFCSRCYKRADTGQWYGCDLFTYFFIQDHAPIGYVLVDGVPHRIKEINPSGFYAPCDFLVITDTGEFVRAYNETVVRVGVVK